MYCWSVNSCLSSTVVWLFTATISDICIVDTKLAVSDFDPKLTMFLNQPSNNYKPNPALLTSRGVIRNTLQLLDNVDVQQLKRKKILRDKQQQTERKANVVHQCFIVLQVWICSLCCKYRNTTGTFMLWFQPHQPDYCFYLFFFIVNWIYSGIRMLQTKHFIDCIWLIN